MENPDSVDLRSFLDAITRGRPASAQPIRIHRKEAIRILGGISRTQDPRVVFESFEKELRKPKLVGSWAVSYSVYSDSLVLEYIPDWSQIERAVEIRSTHIRHELGDAVLMLSEVQFPYFLSQLFSQVSWASDVRVERKMSRDGGIDFNGRYIFQDGETAPLFGQAKHWRERVGSEPIQGFIGSILGKAKGRACVGLFVATGGFTRDALAEIRTSPIKLLKYDLDGLIDLMIASKVAIKDVQLESSRLDGSFWDEVRI